LQEAKPFETHFYEDDVRNGKTAKHNVWRSKIAIFSMGSAAAPAAWRLARRANGRRRRVGYPPQVRSFPRFSSSLTPTSPIGQSKSGRNKLFNSYIICLN
jgi:hypothetical protein